MAGLRDQGATCIACVGSGDPEVIELFEKHDFEAHACAVPPFLHTTGDDYSPLRPRDWMRLTRWLAQRSATDQRLGELVDRIRPDILHLNSIGLAPYARVGQARGVHSVVHVREAVLPGMFGTRKRWLAKCLREDASGVIAICQDNLARIGLTGPQVRVIYNPVSFEQFDFRMDKGEARESLGIPPDAKVVLFTGGRDTLIKGRDEYLRAMGIVRKRDARLTCLTPNFDKRPTRKAPRNLKQRMAEVLGYYRRKEAELERRIEASDLQDRIVRTGFAWDIERYLAASDVVCVLHTRPHFARMVMESGAMKKPVVAFRIGGVEEVAHHERNALTVEPRDVEGVADAVVRLLGDDELCATLGAGGYEQASELFEASVHTENVRTFYGDVLGNSAD